MNTARYREAGAISWMLLNEIAKKRHGCVTILVELFSWSLDVYRGNLVKAIKYKMHVACAPCSGDVFVLAEPDVLRMSHERFGGTGLPNMISKVEV